MLCGFLISTALLSITAIGYPFLRTTDDASVGDDFDLSTAVSDAILYDMITQIDVQLDLPGPFRQDFRDPSSRKRPVESTFRHPCGPMPALLDNPEAERSHMSDTIQNSWPSELWDNYPGTEISSAKRSKAAETPLSEKSTVGASITEGPAVLPIALTKRQTRFTVGSAWAAFFSSTFINGINFGISVKSFPDKQELFLRIMDPTTDMEALAFELLANEVIDVPESRRLPGPVLEPAVDDRMDMFIQQYTLQNPKKASAVQNTGIGFHYKDLLTNTFWSAMWDREPVMVLFMRFFIAIGSERTAPGEIADLNKEAESHRVAASESYRVAPSESDPVPYRTPLHEPPETAVEVGNVRMANRDRKMFKERALTEKRLHFPAQMR